MHLVIRNFSLGQQHVHVPGHAAGHRVNGVLNADALVGQLLRQLLDRPQNSLEVDQPSPSRRPLRRNTSVQSARIKRPAPPQISRGAKSATPAPSSRRGLKPSWRK